MKDKIKKEAIEWYNNNESNIQIDELIERIIDKTTEEIITQIQNELNQEFKNGNLNQPLSISNEYYLHLKMTDIKNQMYRKNNF